MWYQNIRSALFSFVTIHASDGQTDRQTDRRTESRQQYRALHYMQSHGKNGPISRGSQSLQLWAERLLLNLENDEVVWIESGDLSESKRIL